MDNGSTTFRVVAVGWVALMVGGYELGWLVMLAMLLGTVVAAVVALLVWSPVAGPQGPRDAADGKGRAKRSSLPNQTTGGNDGAAGVAPPPPPPPAPGIPPPRPPAQLYWDGSCSVNVVSPGLECTDRCPAIRSASSLAIASPSPEPWASSAV